MARRSSGRRIGKKKLIEAIKKFSGNVSAAADFLGFSRHTVYNAIERWDLQGILDEARERNLDELEDELYTQAKNGNITALIFALKTQGRHRGYSEKAYLEVDAKMKSEAKERNAKEDAQFLQDVLAELEALEAAKKDGPEESHREVDEEGITESVDSA